MISSKFLVLLHEESTPAGTTLNWLTDCHISYDLLLASKVDFSKLSTNYAAYIICGGGMNVDEENKYPWLAAEKKYLKELYRQNKKILGLCLGAQLMAEIIGGVVKSDNTWEVGWHAVRFGHDFLQNKAGSEVVCFHFHKYYFELPKSIQSLGSSLNCKNQIYLYKDRILGFQFHPEVDETWIERNLSVIQNSWTGAVQNSIEIKKQYSNLPLLRSWYFNVLESFFKIEPKLN